MNDSASNTTPSPTASSPNRLVNNANEPVGYSRLRKLRSSFFLIVGIPTLTAALYYGLIASDIFISEAKYAIRTSDSTPRVGVLAEVLGTGEGSAAGNDANIVRDYILSRDMLEQLDTRLDLRSHYSSPDVDLLVRLPRDASEEDFLEYYRNMVTVDAGSDITSLQVKAFRPEIAQQSATNIIKLSEELVNRMTERIISDTLRFSRGELELAEARVRRASSAVTDFRKQSQLIDPALETSSVLSIVTALETQLAEARTELLEAESYMQADSARVRALRTRVVAMSRQIANERHRLANESDTDLNKVLFGYEPLILEQELAQQLYASALTSLEVARTEAQRKQRYLIPFVAPQAPDEALEPQRLWNTLTIFFGACLFYAIGGLAWSAINDHF